MKDFIFGFVIFILCILLIVSVRSCNKEKGGRVASQIALQNQAKYGGITPLQPIKTIRDTIFNTIFQTYTPAITKDDVAESGAISPAYIDSISRALNVASKKITSLTKANMELNAKFKMVMKTDTTTGRMWAVYKDNAFNVKYYPDSNEAEIRAQVGLNFIDHKNRKTIFHRWDHKVEVFTTDERFTINGFHRVIRETPKPSRWGIGAFAGPAFSKDGMTMAFGVGVEYNLIQF